MDYILHQPLFIFLILLFLSLTFILFFGKESYSQNFQDPIDKSFCKNHQKSKTTSFCHICTNPFCTDCIKSYHSLSFCNDHFKLMQKYRWAQILTFETSPNNPEEGLSLQNFKEKIWREEDIPSYIVVDYRINFEKDLIESHVSYYTREQDQETLFQRFQKYKDQA